MTHSTPATPLALADSDGLGQITVDMQAFFEFSFWLAEELDDLIAAQAQKYGIAKTDETRGSRISEGVEEEG